MKNFIPGGDSNNNVYVNARTALPTHHNKEEINFRPISAVVKRPDSAAKYGNVKQIKK